MSNNWAIVIPPAGAARVVMQSLSEAFTNRGINLSIIDSRTIMDSFENMLTPDYKDFSVDLLNQQLISKAVDEEWDHIFIGALAPVTNWTLALLKKLSIKLHFWMYEDYRELSYWKEQYQLFDTYFSVQKEPIISTVGRDKYQFMLTAANSVTSNTLIPLNERKYDVVFVGVPSPYRIEILTKIVNSGFSLAIAGLGWDRVSSLKQYIVYDKWLSPEKAIELYQDSKIGINLSQKSPFNSNSINENQISPRLFELAGAGTIPLTEALTLGNEIYTEMNCITFSSVNEIPQLITALLSQNIGLDILVENRDYIKNNHLYTHRVDTILQNIR